MSCGNGGEYCGEMTQRVKVTLQLTLNSMNSSILYKRIPVPHNNYTPDQKETISKPHAACGAECIHVKHTNESFKMKTHGLCM